MNIVAYFTDAGSPATGLTPTISVWDLSGSVIVNAQNMVEVAGGFYSYNFSTYDEDEDYVIRADGGGSLSNSDRYVYSTNETANVGKILKIEKGKWEITGNQMIFYDDDGTTPIYTYNLQTKSGSPTERDVYRRVPI